MSIENDSKKKQKALKRKEKVASEDTEMVDATPVVDDAPKKAKKLKTGGEETKEKKKDKKEKKEKKEKKPSKEEEDAEVAEASIQDGEDKPKKKSKKQKSDSDESSKKRKLEEVEVEKESESKDAADEDGKKKKKKKKSKDEDTTSTPASTPAPSKSANGQWSYQEHPSLSALPQTEIDSFLSTNAIEVTGSGARLRPILKFDQASFPPDLHAALATFPAPTSIQSVTWPPILSGRDLVGIAATGSGKTLAFGVPALIHIRNRISSKDVKPRKPQILVLSPTRELAMQIQDQFEKFGEPTGAKSVCIYGGVDKQGQRGPLRAGVNIIVATPGRLIDLVEEERSACDLSDISYLVLDEADRMLDLGFEEAIKKILPHLKRKERQTVMFSATWPSAIQKLSGQYLNDPVKVTVGSTDLAANTSIEQRVEVLEPRAKESRLLDLLKQYHKSRKNRILIFALYKKEAARLEGFLKRNGYNVGAIHGDLGQHQRTQALERFKDGSCPLLIATDVAARGIDIPNVEYVINVTFPLTVEDYCHRIGRTGRAGKTGISHTLFTVEDKQHSGSLINVLKQAGQSVPDALFKFGTTVKKKVDPNYGAFVKDVDMNQKGTKITFGGDSDDE
ncbi:RNA-dependent ATPase [Rhizophlyctis rosea]|uniref:RNA helicase n=1 Tax=Rhizophlyctis rosea TaxID=64517 RepID=A0AAD5S937_9FUNG|nr:RNA-dependent ATPase [Rhizophlyctis rosea]